MCTPNRGVLGGEPILVGKNEAYQVEDFEDLKKEAKERIGD